MENLLTLYDRDYAEWAKKNAELLREGKFSELDIDHLVEELEDMGRSERNELENRLLILMAHLLKWQFQYRTLSERWREFKGESWRSTIQEQRKRIQRRLKKSPGLRSFLPNAVSDAYPDSVELAADETGLSPETFPAQCPYTLEELLDSGFFPPS
jgi:hypothetical protein